MTQDSAPEHQPPRFPSRARIQLWLTAPLRCKLGRHVTRDGYWSSGFGMITYHCVNCEKAVRTVPLTEEPSMQSRVNAAWSQVEELIRDE